MEIYVDVVLAENFIIDMFLLIITGRAMNLRYNNKNLCLAATLGSLYTLVMFIPKIKIFALFPFQILVAWIMMKILLPNKNLSVIFKATGIYTLTAFVLSGLSFGFTIYQNNFSLTSSYVIDKNSGYYLIFSVIILFIIVDRTLCYIKEKTLVSNYLYDVELYLNDIKYVVKGFLDTGNELREPATNLPCIIVEERFIEFFHKSEDEILYIPYSAIGYGGKLKGYKVDKVILKDSKNIEREIQAVVCPYGQVLNKENEFNALLSRGVI